MALGLYVHVPFCVRRCEYCYYLSYANRRADEVEGYVDRLLQEFALYRASPAMNRRELSFVYFGGGTPSLLSENQIARLLQGLQSACTWSCVEEATFECAPQSVTAAKLKILRDHGITRISMGVQELNDAVLAMCGRVHVVDDVMRAYGAIRRIGFEVVNLDLIAGLPGQTDESFISSLNRVIAMQPECVTLYALEIPYNTPLFRRLQKDDKDSPPATWDVRRDRLARGFERLEAAGYSVRSGYAAVRDPRRHDFVYQNLQYRGADLMGIGVSAFSYFGGVHVQNLASLNDYGTKLDDGQLPLSRAYILTDEERMIREFILQLKLGSVEFAYFQAKFRVNARARFLQPLVRLESDGWLQVDDRGVHMTRRGLMRVDRLLSEFYLPIHRGLRYS